MIDAFPQVLYEVLPLFIELPLHLTVDYLSYLYFIQNIEPRPFVAGIKIDSIILFVLSQLYLFLSIVV